MMIHIITPSADYNKWLKSFDTQNLIKIYIFLSQRGYKTLDTIEIYSPMSPPSLVKIKGWLGTYGEDRDVEN